MRKNLQMIKVLTQAHTIMNFRARNTVINFWWFKSLHSPCMGTSTRIILHSPMHCKIDMHTRRLRDTSREKKRCTKWFWALSESGKGRIKGYLFWTANGPLLPFSTFLPIFPRFVVDRYVTMFYIWTKQGRIHGHQLRTGGQGGNARFSHFSTRAWRTDRPTDGRTKPLIELRVRN